MDIVIVTYNSQKWIRNCVRAIEKTALKNINLYIVDNHSTDKTRDILQLLKKNSRLNIFEICCQEENNGFGKANNIGASLGCDDVICFINADTEVYEDTFFNLLKEIKCADNQTAIWEMRQVPFEHPKIYDPVTQEVSWASGAAFAVRREAFQKVGGFDEQIFMYAEDVDLSWRIRAAGYRIKYCPNIKIKHYSYQSGNIIKPLQYINSLTNNLLLRYRYGTKLDIVKGFWFYWMVILLHKSPFPNAKGRLIKEFFLLRNKKKYFKTTKCDKPGIAKFINWDYEIIRAGAFVETDEIREEKLPLVSIIVRTCQRPEVLKEALISIDKQTYKNIEVVVIEDGPETAKKMIEDEFATMNIKYFATGPKKR